MAGMPYHLEKGPWCTVLEDYLNAKPGRSSDMLRELRRIRNDGSSVVELDFMETPALSGDPDHPTVADRRSHLGNDWFGHAGNGQDFFAATLGLLSPELRAELRANPAVPDAPSTAQEVVTFATAVARQVETTTDATLDGWPTTGFWYQYFGDVEAIFRESLIRAIEVSLGLEHDEPIPAQPVHQLPIEVFWKCPQRWFEGWVSWRWDREHRTGQVMLMFATPGSGKPILQHPMLGEDAVLDPTLASENALESPVGPGPGAEATPHTAKGLWVICHREHAKLPSTPDDNGTPSGQWSVPPFGPTYVGVGDIVCVQPSERDGGVKPFGRPFIETIDARDSRTRV